MIARMLAMGGKYLLPKFQHITHTEVLQQFLAFSVYKEQIFHKTGSKLISIERKMFTEFWKDLHLLLSLHFQELTVEEVRLRQLTIKLPTLKKSNIC